MPVELSCYLGDLMLRNDRLHALYVWDEKKVMLGHSGRAHTRVCPFVFGSALRRYLGLHGRNG